MQPFLVTEEKKERYVKQGYWGLPTLIEVFEKNAAQYPGKEIFVDSTTRLTFAEAKRYVDRLGFGLLEMGFKRDDVLVIQLPNIVEAALVRLACHNSGILALLIMSTFGPNELKHVMGTSEAKGIVIPAKARDRDYVEMVQELRPALPKLEHVLVVGDEVPSGCVSVRKLMERPAEKGFSPDYFKDKRIGTWEIQELQTTTGSTGLPKISEAFGWNQLLGYGHVERWKLTPDDVLGLPVPFAGGIANNPWPPALICPCKLAFLERFTPDDALKFIEREKVTVFFGVPAIGEMLVRSENIDKYDLSSLRIYFTAGAPMPPSLAKEIEEKMGCKVVGLLGSMDFGPISVSGVDDPEEVRHNSVGKPFSGIEVRFIDESGQDVPAGGQGELVCRGPYSFTGYYKMPEVTLDQWGGDKDGWFRTGDLAKLDKDGNLYIVGRLKDVIKRGAMTIAPVEIEDLLRLHPKVNEVSVASMPDPILGEKVCAFVIPRPGQVLGFDEMVSFLRENQLATFKLPERLEIVSEFPMVGEQKISKKALTDMVTEKLKAEGKI